MESASGSAENGDAGYFEPARVLIDGDAIVTIPEWLRIPYGTEKMKDNKMELNSLVMNYLLMEGYKDAADAFSRESNTPPNVSRSYLEERVQICMAVRNGDIVEALRLLNALDSGIMESFPNVYFKLKRQQLIEIIRSGDYVKAIEFAQLDLASFGEENKEYLNLLEESMALMIHSTPAKSSPFAHLMTKAHVESLCNELNSAIMSHFDLPECSGLQRMLQMIGFCQKSLTVDPTTHYAMSPLGQMQFTEFSELCVSR